MRKLLFLFVCFLYFLHLSHSALAFIPKELSGAWRNAEKNEQGTLTVFIAGQDRNELSGTIVITGANNCKFPIRFVGKISDKRVSIESSGKNVCGKDGKFSIEAVREYGTRYIGTFTYLWMGGVWVSGTFELSTERP